MFSARLLLVGLALLGSSVSVRAHVTLTWVGTTNTVETLGSPTNWNPNQSPAGNDLVFTTSPSTTASVTADLNVNSFTFSGNFPHFHIGGDGGTPSGSPTASP